MIDDNIIKNISNKNQLTEEDEFMPQLKRRAYQEV